MFQQTNKQYQQHCILLLTLSKNTEVNIISASLNYKIPWAEALHFRVPPPNDFYSEILLH